tara:strand:+ start:184880 stop:186259 length:1380 start_codon:yes stop_codon:yes gene_type:complete
MNQPAEDAQAIFTAAIDSVRARPLVRREVRVDGDELLIGAHSWCRQDFDRVIIVGAGKAATQMTAGLVDVLDGWLPYSGWINVPEGTETAINHITVHPARPAGVNEPTEEGVRGTREILRRVRGASPRDLCIALISGGGSALLPAPTEGITLSDKLDVTRYLSGAGADITELNTVRKHLSDVKGGGLLHACRAGQLITLVLSDVLGDPLDLIASGPTVADRSSASDAIAVLAKFDPDRTLSPRVYWVLESASEPAESKNTSTDLASVVPHQTIVLGNNAVAVDEAGILAESRGYNHAMQSADKCEGAADDVGRHLAEMTVRMLRESSQVNCLITGGEPTVRLADASIRGRGGRNQQLVLAAYQHLLDAGLSDSEWSRFALLSGGTDGEDGPTDAAGAILSERTHRRAVELKLDIDDHLRRNDAYTFFQQAGGLLITGPTGTNVCDVRVVVVTPPVDGRR